MNAPASEPAPPEVVDDARSAAAGTRSASKWLASALGAIPSLGVVGAIIAAPGDAGWDETSLWAGVLLAAVGALIGVLGFARVLAPVPLEDRNVTVDITRLPGHPYKTFTELREDTERVRAGAASEAHEATNAEVAAKRAEAEAAEREAIAVEAKAQSEADKGNAALVRRARDARTAADDLRAESAELRAKAAAEAAEKTAWAEQLAERDRLRGWTYGLQATETVATRYFQARVAAALAVLMVASGLVLVALAPNPKSAGAPTLVTLALNDAGKQALGCDADQVQALKTGGTDAAPTVITLPTATCPAKTLTFPTQTAPYGTVTQDEAVAAGG